MKQRILITGGAGFIGSNLARHLLSKGYSVDCVDNLITGRLASISDLRENKNFSFFNCFFCFIFSFIYIIPC